jgi:signal transduction histidine kinase
MAAGLEQERERALNDLREVDRRKDEFLAMLSHELRNPLAPILNAVQVLDHLENRATRKRRPTIATSLRGRRST